ncbi:alpha/beta-hydrolase family protein [Xylanimonas sp. McL0601]|uniref:alpha/beta-hydrolase family protein n=1 Tax=Xylanimonas sp. McL0601 TaxID=3414739 RepID=UPI003CEF56E2
MITGVVTVLSYAATVATQDTLAAVVSALPSTSRAGDVRSRLLLVNAVTVPLGLGVARALPVREDERALRSVLRQAAWRSAATGLGGVLVIGGDWVATSLDRRLGTHGRLSRLPLAVPIGVLVAAGLEWNRRRTVVDEGPVSPTPGLVVLAGSLGAGLGVTAGVAALAVGEARLASALGGALAARLPGSALTWRLAGHAAVLSIVGGATSMAWQRAMQRIERATTTVDPVLESGEDSSAVLATCSGSDASLVTWKGMGREGRRHVLTTVRARPWAGRPAGLPDLSISTVTGEPAIDDPVEVYVGLDNAPSPKARVELALAEMDRTGAWDRSLVMLVSPTGTGYVNYCAVAAAQYLTRGDVATVTLQYSKRPSPLSLGMIDDAREQNRLLWSRVVERVRDLPGERRPRVVLFGESLGAHTSQDVFLHWGTLGLRALGIERALWVGTPYASRWAQEVVRGGRADTDEDLVAVVNDFGQVEAMPDPRRSRLRYVMVSHDNDGVTKFGTDLLLRQPAWLQGPRSPIEDVSPYSQRGVPPRMRWRPITTFMQLLVDMKNAQTPGLYQASKHDYRPDLTRFINEVYSLGAAEEQLVRVEAALAQREQVRERLFHEAEPVTSPRP